MKSENDKSDSGFHIDIQDGVRHPAIIGLSAISLFFSGLLLWSLIAPIQGAAIAQGKVKIKDNRLTLEHQDGGIIKELNVKEGDRVEAGQVLIRLDTAELQADLDIYQREWDAAMITRARLEAEQNKQPIVYPKEMLARLDDEPQLHRLAQGQRSLLLASREAFAGEIDLINQRVEQQQQRITGLQSLVDLANQRLDFLNDDLAGLKALYKKGFTPQIQVTTLQRSISRVEAELASVMTRTNEARAAIAEQRTSITYLKLKRMKKLVQDLAEVQERLLVIAPKLAKMKVRLQRSDIVAPTGGVVLGLTEFTRGGVISPGKRILDIVPSSGHLIVEARFRPGDIDEIMPGMVARVRFTSYSYRDFLPVAGILQRISADVVIDDYTRESAYIGLVEVAVNDLVEQGVALYPGMPAEVLVTLNERSVISYLFEPLLRSFNRAMRES